MTTDPKPEDTRLARAVHALEWIRDRAAQKPDDETCAGIAKVAESVLHELKGEQDDMATD